MTSFEVRGFTFKEKLNCCLGLLRYAKFVVVLRVSFEKQCLQQSCLLLQIKLVVPTLQL